MQNQIRKIIDILTIKEKRRLYIVIFVVVIKAVIESVGIASVMPFMAVISNQQIIHNNKWINIVYTKLGFTSDTKFMIFLGISVFVIIVVDNIFKAFSAWYMLRFENLLNYSLARRLLEVYLYMPYTQYLKRNTTEMGKKVVEDVMYFLRGYMGPLLTVVAGSLGVLFVVGLLIVINPLLAFTSAAILGVSYSLIYLTTRKILTTIGKERFNDNILKYKTATEAMSGIKDLKILGREKYFVDTFSFYANRHAKQNATYGIIAQIPRNMLEILAFGGIVGIVLFNLIGGKDISQTLPILTLYAFAGYRLIPSLQQVFGGVTSIVFHKPLLDAIYADININNVNSIIKCHAKVNNSDLLSFNVSISLVNIKYSYPSTDKVVLNNITIMIPKNTTVGFVGSTGSGKTTTVDIILGLLTPQQGNILVDETQLGPEAVRQWQRNIGYVPQHIYLCDDSIINNIAFGIPNDQIDMEAVIRSARIANIHEFIVTELPDQYYTLVGERGIRLSGGQRQRIGIARALYSDPEVLIMDEATSALDGITEEDVMVAIKNLSTQKTIILIAHRLTTVKGCDCIYYFENGKITANGTYEELCNTNPKFRKMAKLSSNN